MDVMSNLIGSLSFNRRCGESETGPLRQIYVAEKFRMERKHADPVAKAAINFVRFTEVGR
jgi:hypothetical protein